MADFEAEVSPGGEIRAILYVQFLKKMAHLFGDSKFFVEQIRRFSAPGENSHVHVLMHSARAVEAADETAVQCVEPFQLTDRMWICRLPDEFRDIVYRACESPGVPYQEVFRRYGQLYTIALFAGPWTPGQPSVWDVTGDITRFVTFSQLVHPTSIGFGYTVRFTFDPSGAFIEATPGPCRGITEQAFIVPQQRNWLAKSECDQVWRLLAHSNIDNLPPRVVRANANVQHAAYQYFLEVRAFLVASGLEAMLHTRLTHASGLRLRDRSAGNQFKTRTKQLAEMVGVHFTTQDASAVWDHRSDMAHGRDPWASRREGKEDLQQPPELTTEDDVLKRYLSAEELLRATVLRCLRDYEFAAIFASDESVDQAFPLSSHESSE